MPDGFVITGILLIASPFFFSFIGLLEYGWWELQEKLGKAIDCDCRTPKSWQPLGSSFICSECARYWYSTHDNVAWCGWARAPWWKRAQMKLGWELKDRRKVEDPLPKVILSEKSINEKIMKMLSQMKGRIR